jgi:hypothetical protein
VPRTGFDPSKHGFHFANGFEGKVAIVPGFGELPTRGRGGGMAFAALDYWYTGLPVPTHRPQDFPGGSVPEDGTRLADYIYKRLSDSFATSSARQFVTWTLAADPSQVGVTVIAPPRRTRVVVTFAAVTVEDAGGLDGRLSLGLAAGGRSRQWPEVGAIEVEDGKTFEVGEHFEQVLEPNEPLTVTVAGAGAGGESAGVVCERWLGLDGWAAGTHSYRSRTPVRDAPNGAGWVEDAYTIDFVIEATPLGEEAGP